MFDDLALLLRTSRAAAELEQSQLAASLGVRQQAVSGWERGRSRPRRTMLRDVARLLSISEETLIAAGGYAVAALRATDPPLMSCLPLQSLPADRFEDLAVELVNELHPSGRASRFGGPGEKQFGIDILVTGQRKRRLATVQCKRKQQFGKVEVRKAVAAATVDAERHYLFLSRPIASPGARLEIANHEGWQLWDGTDISHFIRALPPQRAIRLVDTYFPGSRHAFLGVPKPGPWLPPEEYFAQGTSQLVSFDWELVGRDDQLQELASHVYSSESALAVLVGRGGIGKTRLLRAVAEAAPAKAQVLVVPGDAPVEPTSFELLASDRPLLIMFDDAHDRSDLNYVLAGIWRRNPNARALIATRPYRWDVVRHELKRNALVPDRPLTIELSELLQLDAEKLAREALGGHVPDALVHRLARLSRDTPLVTVVGGVLSRQGRLDLTQLENDSQVREVIMRCFLDALVADPLVTDPDTRRGVLDAMSALQPFRSNDEAFKQALCTLVGKPYDILIKHVRNLEEAGILRRRGSSLRIAPDLLGDAILTDASLDVQSNQPTGFLDRVRAVADGQVLQHLFVNVSRVDWQIRQRDVPGPSLVDSLWHPLEEEVRNADIEGRRQLIGLLRRVAYFQPNRIIGIARWLIDHPLQDSEEVEARWGLPPQRYRDVLQDLPDMLKPAAFTLETLPRVLNLLWDLAQDDDRLTNQHPGHALRVLQDLAEYEVGKPVAFNDAVIDVAMTWFDRPHSVSPFEVLEPLLATEGSRQTYQEYTLTFEPFPVNIRVVMPVRQRVLDLAFHELQTAEPRRAVAAVQCVGKALSYPSGLYGRPVAAEERDRWTPGFVDVIERVGTVMQGHTSFDPVVVVAVRAMMNWHATYSKSATQPVAERVVADLRDDLADRIALIVHDGWGHLIYDRDHDYEKAQARIQRRLENAVSALESLSDDDVIELLDERLVQDQSAFRTSRSNPGPLIGEIVKARSTLADAMLDRGVNRVGSPFQPFVPDVIAARAEIDQATALTSARDLYGRGDLVIRRAVAQAIGSNRGRRNLADGEFELLMQFAGDDDVSVRNSAAIAAHRLADEDCALAATLLSTIDFSDSSSLADDVFMAFSRPTDLSWSQLSPAQRRTIRERLVAVPDIGEYSVTLVLSELSSSDPDWVVTMLQDRVIFAEALPSLGDYRPVPFEWSGNRLRVREHPTFPDQLRRLQAWVASAPTSWIRREFGTEVFEAVAGRFDREVLTVLEEALRSSRIEDIEAVGAIIRKAPRTLIWDEPRFVAEALQFAHRFGEESLQNMQRCLWAATISGIRSGSPGQPYPEDLEQRDRSLEAAARHPSGSLIAKFYEAMASSAATSIERSIDEDLSDDGRDW